MMARWTVLVAVVLLGGVRTAAAQWTTLLDDDALGALIAESSGALALRHFDRILSYSGFAPSHGADETAGYIASKAREYGLEDVRIEAFPSDGMQFFWAFRTEPYWEARKGELFLLDPDSGQPEKRLASFDVHRVYLGRFSTSTRVDAELVDVGPGTREEDYESRDVRGKVVLASGPPGAVHRIAVWGKGALGAVVYRTRDHVERPHLVSAAQIVPFRGPAGEPPGFVFALSYAEGAALSERAREGERLRVRAVVEAETKAGSYRQVHAVIRGTAPELPEVWIQAHTNHRNTGGGNNLTGVGATLDLARTLSRLIEEGRIARPKRSVHFVWGPEHMAIVYYLHEHPEALSRILAFLNLDMVGDHQVLSESVLRLYRTPYSLPSFLNDVVQEMFEVVGDGNSISLSRRRLLDFGNTFRLPIVEPTGSRDPFYYYIERFSGPSDHEDIAEASLGVHAVLFNTWPDPYIGTQEDTRQRADATQMKRAEVIAGASAYILATAGNAQLPALVQNALAKAKARLAEEEHRAMSTGDGALARVIIEHAYRREAEAARTLERFATDETHRRYVRARAEELGSGVEAALARLEAHREVAGLTDAPAGAPSSPSSRLVPVRTGLVRGPVNFFRPQYGRDWMTEKTGDPGFVSKLALARRGHYYLYETLNFADGVRNLGQIRDAVAVEYGPAPLEEIEAYFRLLERAGVVELKEEKRANR